MRVEIYMKDTPTENNKSLITFLKRNLKRLNTSDIVFDFVDFTVEDDDVIEYLRSMRITRFPAMVIGNDKFIGSDGIKKELEHRAQRNKIRSGNKSMTERIEDYQQQILLEGKKKTGDKVIFEQDDDLPDEGDNLKKDLLQKLSAERQRRKMPGIGDAGGQDVEQITRGGGIPTMGPTNDRKPTLKQRIQARRGGGGRPIRRERRSDNIDNNSGTEVMDIVKNNPNASEDDMLLARMFESTGGVD